MPRVLEPPEFAALVNSGQYQRNTCVVITLGGGTELHFATADLEIGAEHFLPNLGDNEPLKMSLTSAIDRMGLKAQNIDLILGQQIVALSNALEGATAVIAAAFQDQDRLGPIYYDEKMPGDIMTGGIDQEWVEMPFVGEIYAAQVSGETVSSVFPYIENAVPVIGRLDPDDLQRPGTIRDSVDIPMGPGARRGRLRIADLVM